MQKIPEITLNKPNIGEPCNGCGLCCSLQVCKNGAFALKLVKNLGDTAPGPCPALVDNKNGTFSCGIVINPKKYIKNSKYPEAVLKKNFATLIGSGYGCDELETDAPNSEIDKLNDLCQSLLENPTFKKNTKIALKVIHGIE